MHPFATAVRALRGQRALSLWTQPVNQIGQIGPIGRMALLAILTLAVSLTVPAAVRAQGASQGQAQGPVRVTAEEAPCVPNNDNGLIRATVQAPPGGTQTRLYFRWDGHGDFYYVVMEALPDGTWWATPPKPTDENKQIEYFVAVVAPDETVAGRSETILTPVTSDCPVVLDDLQRGYAENLIVGETTEDQMGDEVMGFLCDGIISRIGSNGVLRADSICRRCIVAWWDKPEAIVPAAVLLGGGVTISDIEASPSRP